MENPPVSLSDFIRGGNHHPHSSWTSQLRLVAAMACSLASCTLPGTACGISERVTFGCRASCGPAAALQLPRMQQPGSWCVSAAAPAPAAAASTRSLCQQPARRRGILRSRRPLGVVATMPDPTVPETEKERSPLDYPQVSAHAALEDQLLLPLAYGYIGREPHSAAMADPAHRLRSPMASAAACTAAAHCRACNGHAIWFTAVSLHLQFATGRLHFGGVSPAVHLVWPCTKHLSLQLTAFHLLRRSHPGNQSVVFTSWWCYLQLTWHGSRWPASICSRQCQC